MIEVYVLLTLGALGYLLNKNSTGVKRTTEDLINVNEVPSMKNIYESNFSDQAEYKTRVKADKKYKQSIDSKKTGIISDNYHFMKEYDKKKVDDQKVMSLSGEYINKESFTHNNMVPFYGGSVRQNMDDNSNRSLLENFTGVSDMQKNKCEVGSFYDLKKDVGNVNGMQSQTDFYKDRIVAPTIRNNDFPIPKTYVGPGLGQGYTSTPTGGYQQFDIQQYAQDKCVDELRTKKNPNPNALGISDTGKQTFEARTVDGLKSGLRGQVGKVSKNRVETFYEQTPDMLLKTTAANLKPSKIGKFNVKDTNRLTTTKQYIGTAFASANLARKNDPNVRISSKEQFQSPNLGTASMGNYGVGTKYDYGKSKILVYNNERDVTSTRVYQGNITSIVKAIIAPIEDMIKITKKQHTVDNPRHFGNLNYQGPKKATVYDPNDVARSTIKETLIHDTIVGNLKGNDKMTVYDPNDIARTTIKETLIHDEIGTGTLTGAKQLYVYDPDEIAKKTIRETLDRMDYEMNVASHIHKGKVYDPNDTARTTIKETTVNLEREYGNINAIEGGGGYETNEFDAKDTQKQFLSQYDYIGIGTRDVAGGYETNEFDAKDTQKQFLSDIEYFGIADAAEDKKQMSYEDMYNATITERKEVTLFGREPTQTGNKVFNDCLNVAAPRKQECDIRSTRVANNADRVYNSIPALSDETITKTRRNFDIEMDNRLDISLLDAFKENPYTQPLNSVA